MQPLRPFPEHLVPLTKHHHIKLYNNLMLFWGAKEFNEFLDKTVLITGDRLQRQGFTHDVMKELFNIQRAHAQSFPVFDKKDIWNV
jgi:hypothetical protein